MSKSRIWTGRIMLGIFVLFMAFDGVIHALHMPFVTDIFTQLGYSPALALPLGIIELACLALFLIPKTKILGAILLTGYLGGAVATNLRVGAPFFSNILFPIYIGILLWGGLYLLEPRISSLIPFKKPSA